jgi:Zn-dependent alcohol dehydrogenase
MLARDNMPFGSLVTHTLPLEHFAQAFELMERGEALRVILKAAKK